MKIKAIVLDLDFTLVDASRGIHLCIAYALQTMGYARPDFQTTIATIGLSLPDTFNYLTQNDSANDAMQFDKLFVEHSKKVLIDNTYLFDTVRPFLNEATEQGYQLAIVTSKYRDGLDNILAKYNIRNFFAFHIAGDEVTYTKPHPMSLERALSALNIMPHESIYVGDSIIDAEAAKRANMQFIGVLTGQTKKEAFVPYPSVAIINDLTELLRHLS